MAVYHGTDSESAEAILRDGFVDTDMLDAVGRPVEGVFVTNDPTLARGFARQRVGQIGGSAVVLAVEVGPALAARVAEDFDSWGESLIPAADLNRCSIRVWTA